MKRITNGRQRRVVLARAIELLEQIGREYNLSVKSLCQEVSFAHIVAARRDFCIRGRAMRIQTKILADALNCHHTTVTYHANQQYRAIKNRRNLMKRITYRQAGGSCAEVS